MAGLSEWATATDWCCNTLDTALVHPREDQAGRVCNRLPQSPATANNRVAERTLSRKPTSYRNQSFIDLPHGLALTAIGG